LYLDLGNISECGHGTEQKRCDMKLAPPPRSYRRSVEPLALQILYWAFRRKFLLIFGTSRLGFGTISSIVPFDQKSILIWSDPSYRKTTSFTFMDLDLPPCDGMEGRIPTDPL